MKIARLFTRSGVDPLDQVVYETRSSLIADPDGSVIFEIHDAETPESWSQLATDIIASKYFRKAGVPGESGRETSVRQVIRRIARTIRGAGERAGYFTSREDADTFQAETEYILVHQIGAFNSPVWFNCGLFHEYGIEGSGGNWRWDDRLGRAVEIANNYESPQCSACFIQSVDDNLMSIFELLKNEARIFKYGSGTGTNFATLRGRQEPLSGGGTSSGLMSFLEVFDRAAGATKSGGTTRRAAKMVCLDADHPEVRDFVRWKAREENKARALIREGYPADFNGEAYHTISGQNSNNSVRLSDEFMGLALSGGEWQTRFRLTGEVCESFPASDLLDEICEAAWQCADPGLQFDTTINEWNTAADTARIRASNPCSEYMFLDDTACNLASINLTKLLKEDGTIDVAMYRHVVGILFLAQEILVDFSSYPTEAIARNSHWYRPLGLGYANLGALLMRMGIAYDSADGAAICGALTAIMTGEAYAVSARIAAQKGPFDRYAQNRGSMLRVIEKHCAKVAEIGERCPPELRQAAGESWNEALALGRAHGYRNAQATVLAPTGTIGLLMDCDTTGIEPEFALVKFKKLAGGGYFKIVNSSVPPALRRLGYSNEAIEDILRYAVGRLSFHGSPHIHRDSLLERGLTEEEIDRAQGALRSAFDLSGAFAPHVIGREAYVRLGLDPKTAQAGDLLVRIGFGPEQIQEADEDICGRMTLEGAPGLKPEHQAVFDCANRCGRGTRVISPMGHLSMMAAAQPFISGAISKTVNLPSETTVEEIRNLYVTGWKMGLKAVAIYRDGSKASQPLSSSKTKKKGKEEREASAAEESAAASAEARLAAVAAESSEPQKARRRRLPKRRGGFTQEARVGGHKVFLRTGEYEDGTLGEIFIDMHKEGAAFRSMMNCFAIAVSKGLQYGVPLEEFVETFTFTRFEPQGMVDHPNIRMATSVIDYVFRVLGLEYLGRTDFCQIKPEDTGDEDDKDAVEESFELYTGQQTPRRPVSNGNGSRANGREAARTERVGARAQAASAAAASQAALNRHMESFMGDAPFCDVCGNITMRNGSCYRCQNCGNSMGCS